MKDYMTNNDVMNFKLFQKENMVEPGKHNLKKECGYIKQFTVPLPVSQLRNK